MFLREFFRAVIEEIRNWYEDVLSAGPTDRLRRKLRLMYGRGEIGREKFFVLSGMLDRGYYIEGELATLHTQAMRRMGQEGRVELPILNLEIARGLEKVYLRLAILEEVRAGMRRVLKTVEAQRTWSAHQSADFWERAQAALPDENAARAYLEVRQQLVDHLQVLEQREKALHHDLHRLDALDAQLRLYESEMMMLDSRERLARVELSVRKELHW